MTVPLACSASHESSGLKSDEEPRRCWPQGHVRLPLKFICLGFFWDLGFEIWDLRRRLQSIVSQSHPLLSLLLALTIFTAHAAAPHPPPPREYRRFAMLHEGDVA